MTLSPYHQKYASRSDEEMQQRADVKREELKRIFVEVSFTPTQNPLRVAVLGCGERRLVAHHKRIFEELLNVSVDMTTFDITIDHLEGEDGVVQHDVTRPLPGSPYDIAYAHVLLKFIDPEKQWDVVKNSYDALREGGVAIHVFDRDEIDATEDVLPDGSHRVDLNALKRRLDDGIQYQIVEWTIEDILPEPLEGLALVLVK